MARTPLHAYLTRPGEALSSAVRLASLKLTASANDKFKLPLYTYSREPQQQWWLPYLGLSNTSPHPERDDEAKAGSVFDRCTAPDLHADTGGRSVLGAIAIAEVAKPGANGRRRQYVIFCFGTVTHLINKSTIVPDFGLLLVEHFGSPAGIVSADTLDPTNIRRQRNLLPTESTLAYVDPEVQERILRRLTSRVSDQFPGLPIRATGAASVQFSSTAPATKLESIAEHLFRSYQSAAKEPRPDNGVQIVRDLKLERAADRALLAEVRQSTRFSVQVPAIGGSTDGNSVADTSGEWHSTSDPLDFTSFVDEAELRSRSNRAVEVLKSVELPIRTSSGYRTRRRLYDCLNGTLQVEGETLALADGSWYRIQKDLLNDAGRESRDRQLIDNRYPLRSARDYQEADYNMNMATRVGGICLDRKSIASGSSGIEPCDVIWMDRDELVLTHVKKGFDSSELSHLFYQGQVAALALTRDAGARAKLQLLIEKVVASKTLGLPKVKASDAFERDNTLRPEESRRRKLVGADLSSKIERRITDRRIRVDYLILSRRDRTRQELSQLPLFSQISFARTSRLFSLMGVPTTLRIVGDRRE